MIQVNVTEEATSIPPLTEAEFTVKLIEYPISDDKKRGFKINHITFEFSYLDELLAPIAMFRQIFGFYSWLQTQEASIMSCGEGQKMFMVTVKLYVDPSIDPDSESAQMTCHLGTQNL